MKRCSKCGQSKAVTEYYAAKGTRDGLRGECKACFAARAKRWYSANREHAIARVKQWQLDNPERVKATRRVIRERRKDIDRDLHLQRKFGIGTAEYEALLEAQGGVCAICGRPPRKGSSLHVDHDHDTGLVRGLLCFRCNGGLGQFAESPQRLMDAAEYLEGGLEPVHIRTELIAVAVERARGLRASAV
jgi:hypothetical protein